MWIFQSCENTGQKAIPGRVDTGRGTTNENKGRSRIIRDVWSAWKALSHLVDLARRSYTGAQICLFSGIGTSTAAQRYLIGKNGSTSSEHRRQI